MRLSSSVPRNQMRKVVCPDCNSMFPINDQQETQILNRVIRNIASWLRWELQPMSTSPKIGGYPYIPAYNISLLAQCLLLIKDRRERETSEMRFLDAGCGVGFTLLTARAVGFDATGIEYDPKTAETGRKIITDQDHTQIITGDILEFKMYDQYDVIYYYCPFSDENEQKRFERLVEDTMKVGGYLISVLKKSERIFKDERFEEIYDGRVDDYDIYIFKKVGDTVTAQ